MERNSLYPFLDKVVGEYLENAAGIMLNSDRRFTKGGKNFQVTPFLLQDIDDLKRFEEGTYQIFERIGEGNRYRLVARGTLFLKNRNGQITVRGESEYFDLDPDYIFKYENGGEIEDDDFEVEDDGFEPDDDDCFIYDNTRGGYDVSCTGDFIGNYEDFDEAVEAVKSWQKENNWFPNVWFINDHGNASIVDIHTAGDLDEYAKGGGVESNQLRIGTRIEFLKRIFVDSEPDFVRMQYGKNLETKERNVKGKTLIIRSIHRERGIISLIDTDKMPTDTLEYSMTENEIRELERKGWIKIDNSKYGKLGKVTQEDLRIAKDYLSWNKNNNREGIYFDGEKWEFANKDKRRSGYNYMEEFVEKLNQNKVTEADLEKYAKGGGLSDYSFTYRMLDRLRSDCDYYLGYGNRHEKHLWAGNVDAQIKEMKRLWNSLPEGKKPEWLSMEDILEYEKKMKSQSANGGAMGSGGEINANYLDTIPAEMKSRILKNIAANYGISPAEAEEEVRDADAEMLYEYIANDQRLRMDVYREMQGRKYAKGGEMGDEMDEEYINSIERLKEYQIKSIISIEEADLSNRIRFMGTRVPNEWKKYSVFLVKYNPKVFNGGYAQSMILFFSNNKQREHLIDLLNNFEGGSNITKYAKGGAMGVLTSSIEAFDQIETHSLDEIFNVELEEIQDEELKNSAIEELRNKWENLSESTRTDLLYKYVGSDWRLYNIKKQMRLVKKKYPKAKVGFFVSHTENGKKIIITATQKDHVVYRSDVDKLANGGEMGGSSLGTVNVKFANPKYNYSTNVSPEMTEADARKYFVGKFFDVGTYPKENLQKVTDIEFIPGAKMADGGEMLTMPKSMIDEIKQSVDMGFNIVKVGMISPKRRGVVLVNEDYQVRGTYPLEYKEWIENIVHGKMANGGEMGEDKYEDNVDALYLKFKDAENYQRAKDYFESGETSFYPYEYNDEFMSIGFQVMGKQDADSTEFYIEQELQETDISGYYFESESGFNYADGGEMGRDKMEVAKTIYAQIGRLTFAMLGAYNFVGDTDSLAFRIRGSKKANYIKITLTDMDDYTVEFGKIKNVDAMKAMNMTDEEHMAATYKVVNVVKGVYFDDLHNVIEENTGLYTKFAAGGEMCGCKH